MISLSSAQGMEESHLTNIDGHGCYPGLREEIWEVSTQTSVRRPIGCESMPD